MSGPAELAGRAVDSGCYPIADQAAGDVWDRLAGAGPVSRGWTWIHTMAGRIGTGDSVIAAGDGAAYGYLLDGPSSYGGFDPVRIPGAHGGYPAAVCALPNSYLGGFVGTELTSACARWDEWASQHQVRTAAWLHVEAPRRHLIRGALLDQGYTEIRSGGVAFLNLPQGASGYPGQLGRHRRTRVRAELRAFDDSGWLVRRAERDEFGEALAELQLATYSRHGFSGSVEHVLQSHAAMDRAFGADYRLLIAEYDGTARGFISYVRDETSAQPRHLGFDDSTAARRAFLYFNLAYYRLVADLAGAGSRQVVYGPGALRAKLLRGCVVEPAYSYVRTSDPELLAAWQVYGRSVEHELAALGQRDA